MSEASTPRCLRWSTWKRPCESGLVARARGYRCGPTRALGQVVDDRVELVGEHLVGAGAGVVQERDLAGVLAVAQGADHRHDRGDAGAAAEHQHMVGHVVGQHELALGLRQVDDRARRELVVQELRDVAVGVRLDRDAEGAVAVGLRAGDREHPDPALAVDLDAELHVLAGHEAAPRAVGPQHDGAGVSGLVDDLDDAGAHLVDGEHRVDLFEVVVDGVGRREGPDSPGAERAANDAHVDPFSLSERLYTQILTRSRAHGNHRFA